MMHVEKALSFVRDDMAIGLGTGHAAEAFTRTLGERVREGLRLRAVPTSGRTEQVAKEGGIPLVGLDQAMPLDLAVDGADEVDPQLNLIKGYGHALLREKIVAVAAQKFIILIGPEQVQAKLVKNLGERGKLPIEVTPFGVSFVLRRLRELGLPAEPVRDGDSMLLTENGNYVLECRVGPISDPFQLERQLQAIPGVVETGLFLGLAHLVLVQEGEGCRELRRP